MSHIKSSEIEFETVLEARDGNDEALSLIFDSFRNYITGLSRKYFLVGADSDDLIQEGMIGLFKAIRDYSPDEGSAFGTFASVCIVRQIKSAIKMANRKKHLPLNTSVSLHSGTEEGEGIPELFAAEEVNPEEIYINKETSSLMNKILFESLSKLELKIFSLYSSGLSYREISEVTGKTVKSVDNAVQRIKKKIEKVKNDYLS